MVIQRGPAQLKEHLVLDSTRIAERFPAMKEVVTAWCQAHRTFEKPIHVRDDGKAVSALGSDSPGSLVAWAGSDQWQDQSWQGQGQGWQSGWQSSGWQKPKGKGKGKGKNKGKGFGKKGGNGKKGG